MDATTSLSMLVPGLATGLGGLVLLAVRKPSARLLDSLLGFTAGVMLAAMAFSLLVPALEQGEVWEVAIGMTAGAAFLLALDMAVPHAHARFAERGRLRAEDVPAAQRAFLLVSALTIHNLPEGMAVGLAFAAGGADLGLPVAIAIGVQNIPEGFAAAAPILNVGARPTQAVAVGVATGLVEPPAAFLAYGASTLFDPLLVGALAFAAGAMLYVVVDELIPESQSRGNERAATVSLVAGFLLMLVLDNALG